MTISTRISPARLLAAAAGLVLCASALHAQTPAFQSPGGPWGGGFGQVTRFDNDFNPAISFTVDTLADYAWTDGPSDDGFNLALRRFDVLASAWVDPRAWAYATIAYHEGGELELEEAAVEYIALPGNNTFRAGRFFVDFGKQMPMHVEELRTVDRPLVLRTYLGEELGGDGLMWNNFHTVGEAALVRYSLAAFQSLLPHEHAHAHEGEHDHEPEPALDDRAEADELNFTARLTGLTDVGTNGMLQLGGSARWIPSFSYSVEHEEEGEVFEAENLQNAVYGVDLTYAWFGDTGIDTWTLGGEWLWQNGALSAHFHEADEELEIQKDLIQGLFAFVDYRWSQTSAAGVQYSLAEMPMEGKPKTAEYDVYYTHWFSEFLRMRFAITYLDPEENDRSLRAAVQFTGIIGPHSHGVNW